jgi:hypothetical protein
LSGVIGDDLPLQVFTYASFVLMEISLYATYVHYTRTPGYRAMRFWLVVSSISFFACLFVYPIREGCHQKWWPHVLGHLGCLCVAIFGALQMFAFENDGFTGDWIALPKATLEAKGEANKGDAQKGGEGGAETTALEKHELTLLKAMPFVCILVCVSGGVGILHPYGKVVFLGGEASLVITATLLASLKIIKAQIKGNTSGDTQLQGEDGHLKTRTAEESSVRGTKKHR